jgi:FG-GAP-like repeat
MRPPVGRLPFSVVAADLNGDGKPDLAVANRRSNDVTVLLGDGAGGFSAAPGSPVKVGGQPFSVALADLNGDGRTDLAVANNTSKNVSVLLGDGAGGFSAAPGSPVKAAGSPLGITATDLSGDGRIDLAVPAYRKAITILLGDGSGRFAAAPGSPIAVGSEPSVAVADFNGDGKPDLAVADSKKVSIRPGSGGGRFGAARTVLVGTGPDRGFFGAADFNRDGKPDLAVMRVTWDEVTVQIRVLLGNGAGGFRRATGPPIAVGVSQGGVVADLNGDHESDLALADYRVGVRVLLANGAGRFRPAADSPFAAPSPFAIAAADLNGEGKPDLALTREADAVTGAADAVTIMFQTPSTPAAASGGALRGRRDAPFSTRGRITTLAVDGNRVAVITSRTKRRCGRVVVWNAPGRRSRSFKTDEGCVEATRGYYVDQLALGGGQVAWVGNTGGNILELQLLVAKLSGRGAKVIDFVSSSESSVGEWVGQLLGGGPLLAYNRWAVVCDSDECPPGELRITGKKLVRISAGRGLVVKRGAGSFPLRAVGGGRMAVDSAGVVTVLASSGSRVATVPAVEGNPPRAIALSATRLVVARTFTLNVYAPASGAEAKSIPLGPAAALQLAGVNSKLALLRGPRRLVLVRLSDGKLISLPLRPSIAARFVNAKLDAAGLFYAYNVRRGPAKGRIVFEPTAKLLARF